MSGSLQTTVSADAGVIFAKVSTSVGISVGLSKAVTTDSSYAWTVPKSQGTGYVEMGSHGYRISWRYGSYNSSCSLRHQPERLAVRCHGQRGVHPQLSGR